MSKQEKTNPIVTATFPPVQKAVHPQRPISKVYPVIDTDLGRDNVENDLPAADLQDL